MKDMKISDMMKMQLELFDKYKDKWDPIDPKYGRNSLLWLIEELGETIAIVKKRGEDNIMNDSQTRERFIEELSDVLMYYTDVLLRFKISPEEISNAYQKKHQFNILRTYDRSE